MNSGMDAPSQTVTMHHGQRSACTIRRGVFKKRLPVLILAFLIAVMPLSSAVPVAAANDVLVGPSDTYVSFSLDDLIYYFPIVPSNPHFLLCVVGSGSSNTYLYFISSPNPFRFSFSSYSDVSYAVYGADFYVSAYRISFPFDSQYPSLDMVYSDSYYAREFSIGPTPVVSYFGDVTFTDVPSITPVLSSVVSVPSDGLGVLSVFSGVSSWFVSAVNNMIPIFWSVESGLSPIGVLAVCSLALSVVLLFFWLIAVFLKFKF